MTYSNRQIYGLMAAFFLLLLAACGPAPEAPSTAGSDDGDSVFSGNNEPQFEVLGGSEETTAEGLPAGFTADGHAFLGDPTAPILMEEFSDFQCPFCSRFFAQTLPSLKENEIANGEVVLVYYDFPLTRIHPQAFAAHQAGRCAAESGAAAYWAMHDQLFANINNWSGRSDPTALFTTYATEVGLDEEAFATCLASGRHDEAIQADLQRGIERGINSTPSFFLNDNLVAGAQPLSVFQQAVAQLLSGEELAVAGQQQQQQKTAPAVAPTPAALSSDFAASLGNPNAPVTIVEFTDYQCPYCFRHATQTMPQVVRDLVETGRVHYVLKDFPLDSLHPEARQAAVAARCAGDQGAYWEMHDALFASQQEWGGTGQQASTVFSQLADNLDLNVREFNACQESGRHEGAVEVNFQEGSRLGVTGTPSFFIDGYPVRGSQPFEVFDYAVGLAEEGSLADAYTQQQQAQQPAAQPTPAGPVEVPLDNVAFAIGDPNAPVTIIEYTDYQCPYCSRHFQQTYPQIMSEYVETGQVYYVLKDFPLTSIHPQAVDAAEAARCAGDQGAYLEMHDVLFSRQSEWGGRNNTTEIFTGYAASFDLDTETFSACLESGKHEAAVTANLNEGASLGVRGTPAFFINGYLMAGAQPFATFEQAIAQFAAEAN